MKPKLIVHPVMVLEWVLVKKFCECTGYTDDAVRAKISQGAWPEGIMWKKAPDGRVLINTRGFKRWVKGQACAPQKTEQSSSISATKASAVVSDLSSRRRRQT